MASSKVIELRIKQASAKLKTQSDALEITKNRINKLKKDLASAKSNEKSEPKAAKKAGRKAAAPAKKAPAKKAAAKKPAKKKAAKKASAE